MTNDQRMTKSEWPDEAEASLSTGGETPFVREESDSETVDDLEERTARFGEAIIDFAKNIPRGPLTDRNYRSTSRRRDKRWSQLYRGR
jgi:hypothetical protein